MGDVRVRLAAALSDRYEVGEEIGRGGMARVFRARDIRHDREVALKLLEPQLAVTLGPDRFLREIRIASRLQHPNIVPLFDSGADGDLLWYTMPLVAGESVEQLIERSGPLPVDDAVRITRQVATALAQAHRDGIVHRDIKPGNIMLTGDVAVVTDFGVARALDEASRDRLTSTGLAIGSVAYMSPEQWSADSAVDGRSDIYSLGCVLYEMLTGSPPFRAETATGYMSQHLTKPPEPLQRTKGPVPYPTERALFKALEKDPEARFTDASAFGDALVTAPGWRGLASDVATDLWRRRVPHAFVAYLIATWGAVFLARVLADRLMLSPDVPALVLTAMVALLPSVVLIGYFHGGSGRAWPTAERAGVALNAVGAAAILLLLFRDSHLGPVAQPEPYTDSREIEGVEWVPAPGQVRRAGVFFFENRTGDPELDWISYAVPFALQADLDQDLLLLTETGLVPALRERGEERWTTVPDPLKRELARERGLGWVLSGWFEGRADSLVVHSSLTGMKRGTTAAQRAWITDIEGLLPTVDRLSHAIKEGVVLPSAYLARVEDRPAMEMLSDRPAAFRSYVEGMRLRLVEGDPEAARDAMRVATGRDPDFALAWNELSLAAFSQGDAESAIEAKQRVIELDYRLPRWKYLSLLQGYYLMTGQSDAALAVAEERVERYSDDLHAREQLANLYANAGRTEAATETLESLFESDPDRLDYLLRIATIQAAAQNPEAAREAYERYRAVGGDSREGIQEYAEFLRSHGDLTEAEALYRDALLLSPEDALLRIGVAGVLATLGRHEDAVSELNGALESSVSAEQRSAVDSARAELYLSLGRLRAAREAEQAARLARAEFLDPLNRSLSALQGMHRVAPSIGLTESLRQVEELSASLPGALRPLASIGRWKTFAALEMGDSLVAILPEVEGAVARIGMDEILAPDLMLGRADGLRMRGECGAARDVYESALEAGLEVETTSAWIGLSMARLKCGDAEAALAAADSALALTPGSPGGALVRAEALAESGREAEALDALAPALSAWNRADPGFGPAERARRLETELTDAAG
ncbi:MAG: protein kinase [marine benthic group bacterium]|nr:protein kinase [Candidatus Benthicola marisminoris]